MAESRLYKTAHCSYRNTTRPYPLIPQVMNGTGALRQFVPRPLGIDASLENGLTRRPRARDSGGDEASGDPDRELRQSPAGQADQGRCLKFWPVAIWECPGFSGRFHALARSRGTRMNATAYLGNSTHLVGFSMEPLPRRNSHVAHAEEQRIRTTWSF